MITPEREAAAHDELIKRLDAMTAVAPVAPVATDTVGDERKVAISRGMAMAYIWGRQDAGEADTDTGYSQAFASVYALASRLTDGYCGPIQSAYVQWRETGRVLIKVEGKILAVQIPEGAPDTTRAAAYSLPWVGDYIRTYFSETSGS